MRVYSSICSVLLTISVGNYGYVYADSLGSSFTEGLITADFIFKGEVVDVSYRNSTPARATESALPHTFVTYRIDQIFKGSIALPDPTSDGRDDPPETPDTLTLRFLGGSAGDDDYMLVSGTPLFDVGDTDVLMVGGNGHKICPLVRCMHGRYRDIERFMYGEDGQEIVGTSEATVRYGKFHHLRDIIMDQIGATAVARVGEVEINETGMPEPLPDFGIHHSTASFVSAVETELAALLASGVLVPPDPVHSQNIDTAFSVDLEQTATIEHTVDDDLAPADLGELLSDRIEHWFLRHNNGDPILNERQAAWLNRFKRLELRWLNRLELRQDRRDRRRANNGHRGNGR